MAMSRTIPRKYRVDIIESERGWGSKIIDTLYFDTEPEAKSHAADVNSKNTETTVPDYYIYADYRGLVQ